MAPAACTQTLETAVHRIGRSVKYDNQPACHIAGCQMTSICVERVFMAQLPHLQIESLPKVILCGVKLRVRCSSLIIESIKVLLIDEAVSARASTKLQVDVQARKVKRH